MCAWFRYRFFIESVIPSFFSFFFLATFFILVRSILLTFWHSTGLTFSHRFQANPLLFSWVITILFLSKTTGVGYTGSFIFLVSSAELVCNMLSRCLHESCHFSTLFSLLLIQQPPWCPASLWDHKFIIVISGNAAWSHWLDSSLTGMWDTLWQKQILHLAPAMQTAVCSTHNNKLCCHKNFATILKSSAIEVDSSKSMSPEAAYNFRISCNSVLHFYFCSRQLAQYLVLIPVSVHSHLSCSNALQLFISHLWNTA